MFILWNKWYPIFWKDGCFSNTHIHIKFVTNLSEYKIIQMFIISNNLIFCYILVALKLSSDNIPLCLFKHLGHGAYISWQQAIGSQPSSLLSCGPTYHFNQNDIHHQTWYVSHYQFTTGLNHAFEMNLSFGHDLMTLRNYRVSRLVIWTFWWGIKFDVLFNTSVCQWA